MLGDPDQLTEVLLHVCRERHPSLRAGIKAPGRARRPIGPLLLRHPGPVGTCEGRQAATVQSAAGSTNAPNHAYPGRAATVSPPMVQPFVTLSDGTGHGRGSGNAYPREQRRRGLGPLAVRVSGLANLFPRKEMIQPHDFGHHVRWSFSLCDGQAVEIGCRLADVRKRLDALVSDSRRTNVTSSQRLCDEASRPT
jgi:hypothetical protein